MSFINLRRGERPHASVARSGGEPAAAPARDGAGWGRLHLVFTLLSGALLACALRPPSLVKLSTDLQDAALIVAAVLAAFEPARRTLVSMGQRPLDASAAVVVATIGAILLDARVEAAAVAFLFSFGERLVHFFHRRIPRSALGVRHLLPTEATCLRHDGEAAVPVDEVAPGEVVLVEAGELVPLDGRLLDEEASLDEALVTGEPVPVEKSPGDPVYAGSRNEGGPLRITVARPASSALLHRLAERLDAAYADEAYGERLGRMLAKGFTPAAALLAVAVAALPPCFGEPLEPWIYRGLILLILASPAALLRASPDAAVAAVGRAARGGAILRGGSLLARLAAIDTVAFAKGALTKRRYEVLNVFGVGGHGAREALALAAGLASKADHPIAEAILRAAEESGAGALEVDAIEAAPGGGLRAMVDGRLFRVGSPRFLASEGVIVSGAEDEIRRATEDGCTALVVARERLPVGVVRLRARPREEGRRALVRLLGMARIRSVFVFSGDSPRAAYGVAGALGISAVRADLDPEAKAALIREARGNGRRVAAVGAGAGDALALAAADVGIAVGAARGEIALDEADVAVLSDDLTIIPVLFALARRALRTIRVDLAVAIAWKVAALALLAMSRLEMWHAVAGEMGSLLLIAVNSARLGRRIRMPSREGYRRLRR